MKIKKYSHQKEEGFVTTVILIIVALIALKFFFNFDIVAYIKSPVPQQRIQEIWNWTVNSYEWLQTTVLHLLVK